MKKLLSVMLVLSMILASISLLTSCGKVSVKDIEKDAYTTITAAMQNTSESFFEDSAKTERVLNDALKCGAFSLSFENDELHLGALKVGKISETLYVDSKNEKYVSDTSVTLDGKNLGALLFLDKNGIKLKSDSILGSDKALELNIASLKNDLKGSQLAKTLGISDDDVTEVIEFIETLEKELKKDKKEKLEKIKDFYNEIYALCNQTATEEKIEKNKYVVVTHTLNNQTLTAVLNKCVEFISEYSPESMTEDLKTSLDEAIANIDESVEIFICSKTYINQKENRVDKIVLDGSVKNKENTDGEAKISAEITFSDAQIKVKAGAEITKGESVSVELTLNKEKTKESTTYSLSVKADTGSVEIDLLNATYTQATDGNIKLKADVYNGVYDRAKLELSGKLEVTKAEIKLEFNSITVNEDTYKFKLMLGAKAISEIPAAPENAKDVVKLTEEELAEILGEIQSSELGKLLAGIE